MRADDNPLYKATLSLDIDDCSGRQDFETKGCEGHGVKNVQPGAYEVDVQVPHLAQKRTKCVPYLETRS